MNKIKNHQRSQARLKVKQSCDKQTTNNKQIELPNHHILTPGPSPSIKEFASNASLSDSPSEPKSNDWNTDSGATAHMTPHKAWFKSYSPLQVPIGLANGVKYTGGQKRTSVTLNSKQLQILSTVYCLILHLSSFDHQCI